MNQTQHISLPSVPNVVATQLSVDRLTPILAHFSPKAALYFHGKSCNKSSSCPKIKQSYLHIVERGSGSILLGHQEIQLVEQCLIFIPKGDAHSFKNLDSDPLELHCATVDAGLIAGNPILAALPTITLIALSACNSLRELIQMIWRENKTMSCGRDAAVNRLTEYLLIVLLRHILSENRTQLGFIAGLADKKLSLVFNALHRQPQLDWDLEQMAQEAGMSRARFAEHFRKVVGCTPNDYLTQWRMTLARKKLLAGESLKQVAPAVGYQSVAAFHRVFRSRFGQTPKKWLQAMTSNTM